MFLKRILAVISAAVVAVTALTISISIVNAENISEDQKGVVLSGKCGENAEWFINSDATLVISGNGSVERTPWNVYANDIQRIIIENDIVLLSQSAFSNCKNLKEAVFSSTVINLNYCLSSNMTKLADIWIYTSNMENTFSYAQSLFPPVGSGTKWHIYQNSITEKSLREGLGLTDEIEYITEGQKFPIIENRTPVELPKVTETSGPAGFASRYEWDESSKTLTFSGKGAISITDNYYEKYKDIAEHIIIGSGITLIDAASSIDVDQQSCGAFYDFTALKDVDLPDTLTEIGRGSFNSCPSLTSLVNGLPKDLETIGRSAFYKTPLSGDLILSQSSNNIGSYAFYMTDITSVNLNEGMQLGGSSFRNCDLIKEVTIPSDLIYILTPTSNAGRPNCAFTDCESLEKVIIKGGGTVEIGQSSNSHKNGLGDGLFNNCTSLKEIEIESENLSYMKANGSEMQTFDMTNNPTFKVYKGSTTEQTLKDAGYLTTENTIYYDVDTTELEDAIAKAKDIDTSKYTDESVSLFEKALTEAQALLHQEYPLPSEVNKSIESLNDATSELVEKSTKPSSQPPSNNSGANNTNSISNTLNKTSKVTSAKTSAEKVTNTINAIKKAKIKKITVKNISKKKIKVTWKKVNKAKGYQVQVSKKENFKKKLFNKFTSKKKLIFSKKLKTQKIYYVRIRAYYTYQNRNNEIQNAYSKWSKKLKVKIRDI